MTFLHMYVRMYTYVYAVIYFFAATRKHLQREKLSDTESDNGKLNIAVKFLMFATYIRSYIIT